jgi:KAP-like P-loop domain-containing protein
MAIDSDYAFLNTHLTFIGAIDDRKKLAQKVASNLLERIEHGQLPYTMGIFGGWGVGKTTFLALLNAELENQCKVVYFNSWKYAGFMEIVPALIYKILQYGMTRTEVKPEEAAKRVLLALGKKYSDQVGDWAERKIGINVTELFKDAYDLKETVEKNRQIVSQEVIRAYYTQVDKAQDELRTALGTVTEGQPAENSVVVLIDELDRCDPDEAFNVIKQMRVLFGMRDLPVAFVVCANPDPIGLAIKHRYGLESDDYEARRILEKFVDSYEDLGKPAALGTVVEAIWQDQPLPWIIRFDQSNSAPALEQDTMHNAQAFDVITTAIPLLANLRVLHKSFEYVRDNTHWNRHFLWTKWFLEIAKQINPRFRDEIRILSHTIQDIASAAQSSMAGIRFTVVRNANGPAAVFDGNKGSTLFSIFRSFFWEHAKAKLQELKNSKDPESVERAQALAALIGEPLRVDFVVLLALFPFDTDMNFDKLTKQAAGTLPDFGPQLIDLRHQLGWELANT